MRLLLVSDHYPPFIGGAHRDTQLLARRLHERGHAVAVATMWQKGEQSPGFDDGVPVYRIRDLRTLLPQWLRRSGRQRHAPPYPDPVSAAQLRSVIRRTRPEIVHSHGWISFSCAAALLGSDIPLVLSARDYGYFCATRTLLHRGRPCSGPGPIKCARCAAQYYGVSKGTLATAGVFASRPLLRSKAAGVQSVSSYVSDTMKRHFGGVDPSRLPHYVIPSFYSEDQGLSPAGLSAFMRLLPDEPFVLFVGALRRVKGIETLFAAYAKLDSPPPLVLIGTLERDSPPIPSGVVVAQDWPHPAVMAAWKRALFGVFPSLWPEPFGNVVHEAMGAGRAAIGTVPGGHSDLIVDGESGLLVPQGDVDALAGAMRKLIDHPDLREAYGRAALERSKRFSAEVVIGEFERAFDSTLSARSRPPSAEARDVSSVLPRPRGRS